MRTAAIVAIVVVLVVLIAGAAFVALAWAPRRASAAGDKIDAAVADAASRAIAGAVPGGAVPGDAAGGAPAAPAAPAAPPNPALNADGTFAPPCPADLVEYGGQCYTDECKQMNGKLVGSCTCVHYPPPNIGGAYPFVDCARFGPVSP